jgi:hypothetical protein
MGATAGAGERQWPEKGRTWTVLDKTMRGESSILGSDDDVLGTSRSLHNRRLFQALRMAEPFHKVTGISGADNHTFSTTGLFGRGVRDCPNCQQVRKKRLSPNRSEKTVLIDIWEVEAGQCVEQCGALAWPIRIP